MVVPYLARLDGDLMEVYDDAFRTQPKQVDLAKVKKFVEKKRFY